MIRHLSYTSMSDMCQGSFAEIVERSNRNNGEKRIGGVISYAGGTMCQILEGEPDAVAALFEKIERDARHYGVVLISNTIVQERYYASFGMSIHSPIDVAADSLRIIRQYGVGDVDYSRSERYLRGLEQLLSSDDVGMGPLRSSG